MLVISLFIALGTVLQVKDTGKSRERVKAVELHTTLTVALQILSFRNSKWSVKISYLDHLTKRVQECLSQLLTNYALIFPVLGKLTKGYQSFLYCLATLLSLHFNNINIQHGQMVTAI